VLVRPTGQLRALEAGAVTGSRQHGARGRRRALAWSVLLGLGAATVSTVVPGAAAAAPAWPAPVDVPRAPVTAAGPATTAADPRSTPAEPAPTDPPVDDPATAPHVDQHGAWVLGSTSSAPARGRTRGREYAVQVADEAALVGAVGDLTDAGAVITDTWDGPLTGFTAVLTDEQVSVVAAVDGVEGVEENVIIRAFATQSDPGWNLDRLDQRTLPLDSRFVYRGTGDDVDVYVIDSGVRATHAELVGRVRPGAYWDTDGSGPTDCNGHGTHVAGIAAGTTYGVAKQADIVPVKVLDCSGSASLSTVLSGINWVIATHQPGEPAVANLSLGGTASPQLDDAVEAMVADGITVVVAAGNDGVASCGVSPARVAVAITVGASDRSDQVASFSNHGSCNDLFAPGVGVRSAWSTSDRASQSLSGTSMAAPHVTGAAALILGRSPSATPAQVWDRIEADATRNVMSADCCGDPDVLLYVSPTASVPRCRGLQATIVGTAAGETIKGTPARDVIVARGGADTILGAGGNDVICAGGGADVVYAGAGADVVLGMVGADQVWGGAGADRLLGDAGRDTLHGGLGGDVVAGGRGPDTLDGGRGDDHLRGGTHDDVLLGRDGRDELLAGAGRDICRGGAGPDRAVSCEVRRGIP
jgi:subtilisin family serine protease